MQGRATILIVDDEVGVRESLRAILMADYQVLTADTGHLDTALKRARLSWHVTAKVKVLGLWAMIYKVFKS